VHAKRLRPDDLEGVIKLDTRVTGHERSEYLKHKLELNRLESSVEVSLAAEWDGAVVGFLLARVYFGEFGVVEPAAILDTIGVHPSFRGKGVAHAMLEQLSTNLRGLGIFCLRTEVAWEDLGVLSFFHTQGFRPAQRVCLETTLERAP
jgi:predicted N-acetyltransferase YhbS